MFEVLWDYIFPKKCIGCKKLGSYLCANCFASLTFCQSFFCGVCSRPSYNGLTHPKCTGRYTIDGIFPILNYKGLLKKITYQYKYNPHLSDLTGMLGDLMYEGFIQNEILMRTIESGNCVVISVPLHPTREKKRGYNQSDLLAKHVSRLLRIPYSEKVLERIINTTPQFQLPKDKRRENIKNAFFVHRPEKIKGKTIFIIDDITTTGSTLGECARVLKRGGAKIVFGIALGHEEK